jgi:hypothetical protein
MHLFYAFEHVFFNQAQNSLGFLLFLPETLLFAGVFAILYLKCFSFKKISSNYFFLLEIRALFLNIVASVIYVLLFCLFFLFKNSFYFFVNFSFFVCEFSFFFKLSLVFILFILVHFNNFLLHQITSILYEKLLLFFFILFFSYLLLSSFDLFLIFLNFEGLSLYLYTIPDIAFPRLNNLSF